MGNGSTFHQFSQGRIPVKRSDLYVKIILPEKCRIVVEMEMSKKVFTIA
jgi:hypothetical protein